MEYNYLTKEVHMPEKHFRKDRHVKLGNTENVFFAVLWFSKDHRATYQEIFKRVYGYKEIDISLLRNIAIKLRKKGVKLICVYKYGYKLITKDN